MTITINGTTGIAGVDGSAATPAVQGADTNTGIFFPAADTIAFTEGGTEVMRIDSSGQVGIGTSSPTRLLTLSSSGANTRVQINNTVSGKNFGLYAADDGNSTINYGTSSDLLFTESGTERMRIGSSGYMQGTVNGLGAGRIPAMQYYRINSTVAGANSTAAQSVLGVGVTLVSSTQYDLDAYYVFQKTAGTTSHTIGLGFGGTATVNNILYGGDSNGGLIAGVSSSAATFNSNVSTNTQAVGTVSSASATIIIHIKGTVSINAGGTFIPQYTLSAAPGGAYTTQIGSYFRIWPLAASGSNVSIGTWA